ncbi:putative XRE-type DNA-binding protein [Wenyingzhuangia heitensis]|uniref:XRE-type DNA-binding protein n=1 Tax=Wenyingzhuangia heitensis TaxID=1487859 RepID=A0ABX0UD02_9FLAO|nr:SatD family protein [Wenyingzhuangia heitensis]NIJ45700.1 putative XRE-type DNA-binding protein [Wenyingzhuangia heitensis]
MKAVITADIVNSRKVSPNIWLTSLKTMLSSVGAEYSVWEIYRGDSIQLITEPAKALKIAVLLKSVIKQIPNLDIRIGIGIGNVSYYSEKVTSSNGAAFINSGEAFDGLKKNTLAIQSDFKKFDEVLNIMLGLATLTLDNWKPAMAEVVQKQLENPDSKQIEIAEMLQKKQSNVSYSLKKAGYDEIMKCIHYYEKEIQKLCLL